MAMTYQETMALAALAANALRGLRYQDHPIRTWACQNQVRCELTSGPWSGQWVAIEIVGRHERTGKIVTTVLPMVGEHQFHDAFAWAIRASVQSMVDRLAEGNL